MDSIKALLLVNFNRTVDQNPNDRAAHHYLKHSANYMIKGVSNDWTVVESMESKK